jgi:hypothetical protein
LRATLEGGIPSRRLTEEERDTFSPYASLGDVCTECTGMPSTTPLVQAHERPALGEH